MLCHFRNLYKDTTYILAHGFMCADLWGFKRIHLLVQRLAAVMAVVAENPDAGSLQDLSELVMQELG